MRGFNRVIIAGNLAKKPELRYTPTKKAVATFNVAVNKSWKDATGKVIESVDFFRVVVWGIMAENCERYLDKGSGVLLEGRLASRNYEKNSEKKYITEIIANNIQFISSPGRKENQSGGADRQDNVQSYRDQPSEPMVLEADDNFPNGSEDADIPF